VWTDLFQGLLMILAAGVVWWLTLGATGGVSGMVAAIKGSEHFGEAFFEPFGGGGVVAAASLFLVFSIGTLGQPQMLHKLMMVRDLERLRWLPLVLGGSQIVTLLVWLGLGLAVPALVARGDLAPLASPDQAAPVFLLARAPDALAGLVLAGAVAAIMSTADSFLNIAAGALVRDLPRALNRAPAPGLTVLRLAVLAVGAAAIALALTFGDLIALLGTFAFGTFAAALAPVLAIGLNWGRVTARAATASILAGLGTALGLEVGARAVGGLDRLIPVVPGVLPSVVAIGVSLAVLLVVSFLDRRPLEDDRLVEAILSA